jgi:hypothetical protein
MYILLTYGVTEIHTHTHTHAQKHTHTNTQTYTYAKLDSTPLYTYRCVERLSVDLTDPASLQDHEKLLEGS